MRRYLVQDYAFLESFIILVASAIVKAPSLADRIPLDRFLGGVGGEENTYFHRAFDALSVLEAGRTSPTLRPTTRAFHEVMADAIIADRYEETLAPLVVSSGYTTLGRRRSLIGSPERFCIESGSPSTRTRSSMRSSPGSAIS